MFEKEAEELFKKKPLGYEMKPELEIYTDGFKDGYNKANEWHYVKELVEKYRQAVDKCLHITFMGGGCEVNTIEQYAILVDGYLTDVEGLAKWKN